MSDRAAADADVQLTDRVPVDPGRPQKLVLYATPDAWRYSIYTDRYSLEGRLAGYTSPDDAQVRVERAAARILRRPVRLVWAAVDAGWWVAEIKTGEDAAG